MITGLVIGIVIGFVLSMPPLGPTYFAIVERGIKKEFRNAVAIGAGAGLMDMIYILVAYGGVSAIAAFLPEKVNNFFIENEESLKYYLAITGCIVIILYGMKIIFSKKETGTPVDDEVKVKIRKNVRKVENALKTTEDKIEKILHTHKSGSGHSAVYMSFMFGVGSCLSSPTLAASWFATVGYLKSYGLINSNFFTGLFLGIGVLGGTTLWFYIMSKFIVKHAEKINPGFIGKLNSFVGIFLVLIGTVFLVRTFL